MNNIVIHIPHSSIYAPNNFLNKLVVSKKEFNKENIFESDYLINRFAPLNVKKMRFKYSRMYCDVERFKENEVMDKYGMGIIYKKDSNGNIFFKPDLAHKTKIMKYYDRHHNKLNNMVSRAIVKYGSCILLDLHSFSDEYVYKLFKKNNCPDICIGYNNDCFNRGLIDLTVSHFKNNGYTVDVNYPYSGSIIPSNYLNITSTNIYSIMIEVNKRIYLNKDYTCIDSTKYHKLNKCFKELYVKYKKFKE